MKKYLLLLVSIFLFFGVIIFVDSAFAATVIPEFATPAQKLMETLRGPWAKAVAIIMLIAAALVMWFRKDELDGMAKGFLVVVAILSIMTMAEPIVNALFSFGAGALI